MKISKFLYTGFGAGLSPVMPGTAGTFVGLFLFFIEYLLFGKYSVYVNGAIILLLLYPAIRLGDIAERVTKQKDPQIVVIDEVFGYFFAVLFFQFTWKIALAAFVLFRFFDMVKPFPINKVQACKGGFGIFIDDILAGVFTNIILWVSILVLEHFGIAIF